MKIPPDGYTTIPVDIAPIQTKKIGIIGFGNQARPWALNLFDSGLEVYVGLRVGSTKMVDVLRGLIEVLPPTRVAKMCDIICLLIPDEFIPVVLEEDVFPHIKEGGTIVLAHSYALYAGDVKLPANTDCILLAPHGPGEAVRDNFKTCVGLPAQWDVIQEFSADAESTAHALASGLGFANGGLRRIDYRNEAIIDLFSEQAVLVGGLLAIICEAIKVLKDAGYDSSVSRVSCIDEILGTAKLFTEEGLPEGLDKVSTVAAFGASKAMKKIAEPLAVGFRELLAEIESGKFSEDFRDASEKGLMGIEELREKLRRFDGD